MQKFYIKTEQHLHQQTLVKFDDDTGIWIPKDIQVAFGTNGFYLDFEDSVNLGNDSSGNSNRLY